jgi:hypothetical protein
MSKETWEHIKSLKGEFINGNAIAIIWTTEDVLTESENIDTEISEEEAQEVLGILDRTHDAMMGISWDTIRCYINEIIHDNLDYTFDYGRTTKSRIEKGE